MERPSVLSRAASPMNTGTARLQVGDSGRGLESTNTLTRYLVPLGRAAFAGVFVWLAPADFSQQTVAWAAQQGVPLPGLLVPLAGLISLAGGLSVILGYRAKLGAWLLVLFLVPVTIMMHNFWAVTDPTMAQMQEGFFLANLSRIGGALLIAHFGAGPLSLDARARPPAWAAGSWASSSPRNVGRRRPCRGSQKHGAMATIR